MSSALSVCRQSVVVEQCYMLNVLLAWQLQSNWPSFRGFGGFVPEIAYPAALQAIHMPQYSSGRLHAHPKGNVSQVRAQVRFSDVILLFIFGG
jgi:hypothetical protein